MNETTPKRVGLVGHCSPDSAHLTMAVTAAVPSAKVIRVTNDHGVEQLLKDGVDLLLVNRKMEPGYAEEIGTDYIRRLRAKRPEVKMMLVSNYPDAIQQSVEIGALPGFGKAELLTPATKQKLQSALM
jgi:hypothetical protein